MQIIIAIVIYLLKTIIFTALYTVALLLMIAGVGKIHEKIETRIWNTKHKTK